GRDLSVPTDVRALQGSAQDLERLQEAVRRTPRGASDVVAADVRVHVRDVRPFQDARFLKPARLLDIVRGAQHCELLGGPRKPQVAGLQIAWIDARIFLKS